jgi:hypothetical protein
MVMVWGPIVTDPVRAAASGLTATTSVSVAERLPLAVAGRVIHGARLCAVQAQPVSVSMVTATSPPLAETVVFAGATL